MLKARARVLGSWLVTSCWILGIIVGVQGWTPIGADWFASSGSSLWSSCGSAMCACPLEVKTTWQNHQRIELGKPVARQNEKPSDPDCPLCITTTNTTNQTDDPNARKRTSTLFCFVALGDFRPQQSRDEGSLSEPLIVDMPPAEVAFVQFELQIGQMAVRQQHLPEQNCFSPEPPPPRLA